MGFIIGEDHIEFEDYEQLRSYGIDYYDEVASICKDWYDEALSHMSLTSSGTTATPKIISHFKVSMRTSARKTQGFFKYKKGDIALLSLPVHFIGGMMMLIRAIESDLHLILREPSSRPLRNIQSSIDFIPMTPHQLNETIEKDLEKLSKVKTILLGGASVSSALQNRINNIPSQVYLGYGMSETITHVAVIALNGENCSDEYTGLTGFQFSLDDNSCLKITSDHLPETVSTNDVVELISDTSFKWIGRLDNVINSGGIKLYPEKIEAKLQSLISELFFIAGVRDDRLGYAVSLIIEDFDTLNLVSILNKLKETLDKYEQPMSIYVLDEFERTETGKVKRTANLEKIAKNNIEPLWFKS